MPTRQHCSPFNSLIQTTTPRVKNDSAAWTPFEPNRRPERQHQEPDLHTGRALRISLSIIIRLIGFTLGAILAAMWTLLMWPDFVSHMYDTKALRHLALLVFGAIAILAVVIWPFWRLSEWLNPIPPGAETE